MNWKSVLRYLPVALIAFIGACYVVLGLNVELAGDDLSYYINGRDYYGGSLLRYPQWVLRHWVFNNGRIANYIAPLLLFHLPGWVLVVLNALATAGFFALMLPAMHIRYSQYTTGSFAIALLAFTMPWWDTMLMFDISLNYVWMSVIALGFVLTFRRAERVDSRFWPCLLALLAGATHEALSLPLLVGFAVWLIPGKRYLTLTMSQKRMLLWFAIGTATVVFSPGTLMRGASFHRPDAPLPLLLGMSCFYVFILVAFMAAMYVKDRHAFVARLRSPWVVWLVAACVSTALAAFGGIIGRSGWFAQMFALIAFGQWFAVNTRRLPRPMSFALPVVFAGAVVFHYLAFIHWQKIVYNEAHEITEAYTVSSDGTVFADVTPRTEVPWYVLLKVYGAPSPNNVYALYRASETYHATKIPLNIIPTQVKSHLPLQGDSAVVISERMTLMREMPKEAGDTIPLGFGRRFIFGDDVRICVPFAYEGENYVLTQTLNDDPVDW